MPSNCVKVSPGKLIVRKSNLVSSAWADTPPQMRTATTKLSANPFMVDSSLSRFLATLRRVDMQTHRPTFSNLYKPIQRTPGRRAKLCRHSGPVRTRVDLPGVNDGPRRSHLASE